MRSQAGVSHADIQVHFVPTQVKELQLRKEKKKHSTKVISSVDMKDNFFL